MTSLLNFLLLLTVFLTPLLGAYKDLGYEQIKVFFFILSITLIAFVWMGRDFKWTGISKAAGVFTLVLLLTSLIGVDPKVSLLGIQPYFQGAILYAYLFLFYLLVSHTKIKLEKWAIVLVGSSTIVAFLAIKDWVLLNLFHIQVPTYAGRIVSTFGQPNFYAGFLLLTLPLTYYLLVRTRDRVVFYLLIIALLLSNLSIIISQSRTTALLLILLLFLWLVTRVKRWLSVLVIFLIISSISIYIANQTSSGILWKEIFGLKLSDNPDLTQESIEKRPYIWEIAVANFSKRPIFGYGLENITIAYSDYFKQNKHLLFEENLKVSPVLLSMRDLNIDRTHNYLLDLALFSGILGLVAWIILVFLLIKKIITAKVSLENSILLTGLVTYLIWIQFQNQSIVHLVYFWLLVGLIDKKS